MNRSLIVVTIAAAATTFLALRGMNEPVAQAQAIEPRVISRAETPHVLPPIRHASEPHDSSSMQWRALTDF